MESVVAAGSCLAGLLETEQVTIDGQFDGEIRATGLVRITERARVKGKLVTPSAEIAGAFNGEIDCQRLVFGATAQAEGRFTAVRLRIDEGAQVQAAFNQEPALVLVETAERAQALVEIASPAPDLAVAV